MLIVEQVKKSVWIIAGSVCLILGVMGIPLPVLPTTPFILLASACFMRGSPRMNQWLLNHATFGPILRNWTEKRSVSRPVKRKAYVLICLSFALSIYVAPLIWVKLGLFLVFLILIVWFSRLPENTEPVA
jgi:uncharacterized membrane protein YbaN (DUF454 family)